MTIAAQPKVSGREARRRLNTLQIQTEEAVIPGIGLLVQSQAEQEKRLDALSARQMEFDGFTFWQRLKWIAVGR